MAEIIEMPKLSDTMTTGTLINWLVKEGDAVSSGTMLAEVETDKATMEVENFEDGFVLKLYAKAGESVAVGDPICAVGEEGEEAPEVGKKPTKDASDDDTSGKDDKAKDKGTEEKGSKDSGKDAAKEGADESSDEAESDESKEEAESSSETPSTGEDRIRSSPLARKMAQEKGLDLTRIQGSGPGGRVLRADVETAEKAGTAKKGSSPKPAAAAPAGVPIEPLKDLEIPITNMRAAIARTLVASKTEAPHFYLQSEVDGAPLAQLRKMLNDRLADLPPEQGGIKFTVNDLILKAAAEAVRRVPAINRSWRGDKIVQFGSVHLAFGVAIDDGLLTPVIRDAQAKGLRQISAEAKDLIGKARNKKLKPDEMQGSTLTVTNLGMFGITDFYGIINPSNAAILSIGATVKTPVVDDKGNITVGYRMKVGLSGDHRVIDGAIGAQYLAALREILEAPSLMLV